MVLNKKYEDALAKALSIEAEVDKLGCRSYSFFPRLFSDYSDSEDYKKPPKESRVATPGALTMWVQYSSACCGLLELKLVNATTGNPISGGWPSKKIVFSKEFSNDEFFEMNLAYVLSQLSHSRFGDQGPGLVFYCNAPDSRPIKILKSFGFTTAAHFVNPIHDFGRLEMVMCHTPKASRHLRGNKEAMKWLDGLNTQAA